MIVGKIDSVSYHRNGVSGEPFYCVAFCLRLNDLDWQMIATLHPRQPKKTRVICVNNPTDGWRGDAMFDLIVDAVCECVDKECLDKDSLYWGGSLIGNSINTKRESTHPDVLASDGFPMEKFDGLSPADHGTDTP
jgi:hypothetical protein